MPPPSDEAALLRLALKQRPDLCASDLRRQSAEKYTQAQADRRRPIVSAIGTIGGDPVRPGQYFNSSWNGAVGANISVPIFDGYLSRAQDQEAQLRALVASEQSRQLRDRVIRDIRTAWLQAQSTFQRRSITAELLEQANQSLKVAKSQYELGLASFMELSNAERQQNEADIANTNAGYLYRLSEVVLRFQVGVEQ